MRCLDPGEIAVGAGVEQARIYPFLPHCELCLRAAAVVVGHTVVEKVDMTVAKEVVNRDCDMDYGMDLDRER